MKAGEVSSVPELSKAIWMVKSTPRIANGITSFLSGRMGTAVRQAHKETKIAPRNIRQKALQIGGMESTPILMDTTLPAHRIETKTARSVVDSPMGSGAERCKGLVYQAATDACGIPNCAIAPAPQFVNDILAIHMCLD